MRCSRCSLSLYCSVKCQAAAWKNGHKKSCTPSARVSTVAVDAPLLGLLGPQDDAAAPIASIAAVHLALAMRGLSTQGDAETLRSRLAAAEASAQLADEDVILCTTAERAALVAATAKALELPYVPFRVLLAEGRIAYGGEMTGTPTAHLRMQPVWVSAVGEMNSVSAQFHSTRCHVMACTFPRAG